MKTYKCKEIRISKRNNREEIVERHVRAILKRHDTDRNRDTEMVLLIKKHTMQKIAKPKAHSKFWKNNNISNSEILGWT